MKSMTGYGNASVSGREFSLSVEIQAYNNRFLEIKTRIPQDYLFVEKDVVREVSSRLSRGRVNVIVNLRQGSGQVGAKIDEALAQKYWTSLQRLWKKLKAHSPPEPSVLLGLPGVLQVAAGQPSAREFKECLRAALRAALDNLEQMRNREGTKLRAYLLKHLRIIARLLEAIKGRIESGSISGAESGPPSRLPVPGPGEASSRPTVQEEISRLESHLEQFEETIGSDKPVGKVLDFIALEMLRETTTLGDKANDVQVSQRAVMIKSEIENLREQIRNLE